MAKTDDGEFELVLGNRQLVGVFLIMVVFLGVFFSMGYIVGRNSAPLAAADSARNTAAKPIVVEHPAVGSEASAANASIPKGSNPNSAGAAREGVAAPADTPPLKRSPVRETAAAQPPAKEEKTYEAAGAPLAGEPSAGDYWQVVATTRPDAEIISEALAKKGFKALVAPAPKDGLFRVLVGPMRDPAAMAQTRTQLEAAGFKNPLVRKY